MEGRVEAAAAGQVLMRSVLDDASLVDRQYPVRPTHCRKAVGNYEDCTAVCDASHVLLDDALAVGVERASGLVEDQNPGIYDKRPRYSDPLSLAAGKVASALADDKS